jgi:hypothetical protein
MDADVVVVDVEPAVLPVVHGGVLLMEAMLAVSGGESAGALLCLAGDTAPVVPFVEGDTPMGDTELIVTMLVVGPWPLSPGRIFQNPRLMLSAFMTHRPKLDVGVRAIAPGRGCSG